ncbi:GGDEF domain-containing protein [Phyllobacterium leguminum]|uniref:diguanylate cyclase n=1 Tax=Phyllobacterium leguminum TaxID=314237 RepID=A0A318TJE7_9HYPH|nr:GGDEF domain-containing protein [Phyllobacterium leguminum]PYE89290.1 diguanylate cyclase (GGDEF)-like protein [Phyllobacterium leguminum]
MTFIAPILLAIFALAFVGIWGACRIILTEHRYNFLLAYGASFLAFSLAMLVQFAHMPDDAGYNAIISGSLYIGACLLLVKGILGRSNRTLPAAFYAGVFFAILVPLSYFYYIDRNLIARIYLLNFGMGGIFLFLAARANFLRHGTVTDRILFWLVVALGLQFFVSIPLTIGSVTAIQHLPPVERLRELTTTSFWIWSKGSVTLLGATIGLGLITISGADIITALRGERDTDPLTGALNRRGLDTHLPQLLARNNRAAVSVIVCDLDYFKSINDTYGHAVGDAVLTHFTQILKKSIRSTDLVARIGGEEFVLVLAGMTVENAYLFAERIRKAVQSQHFEKVAPTQIITCSFGITGFRKHDDLWAAVKRADGILYAAKKAGRNRTYAEGIAA